MVIERTQPVRVLLQRCDVERTRIHRDERGWPHVEGIACMPEQLRRGGVADEQHRHVAVTEFCGYQRLVACAAGT